MTLKISDKSFPLASSLPLIAGVSDINLLTFRSPLTSRPRPVSANFLTTNVCLSRFMCVSALNVTVTGELGICLPEKVAWASNGLSLISLRVPLTPTSIDTLRKVLARASCPTAARTPDRFSPWMDNLPSIVPSLLWMSLACKRPSTDIPRAFTDKAGTLILPEARSASNSTSTSKLLLGAPANFSP